MQTFPLLYKIFPYPTTFHICKDLFTPHIIDGPNQIETLTPSKLRALKLQQKNWTVTEPRDFSQQDLWENELKTKQLSYGDALLQHDI